MSQDPVYARLITIHDDTYLNLQHMSNPLTRIDLSIQDIATAINQASNGSFINSLLQIYETHIQNNDGEINALLSQSSLTTTQQSIVNRKQQNRDVLVEAKLILLDKFKQLSNTPQNRKNYEKFRDDFNNKRGDGTGNKT